MPEPSHLPCPMCGKSEEQEEEYYIQSQMQRAIDNLKFLNLGFALAFNMTDLERRVFYHHQIRKCTFKEIADLLSKSEGSIKMAWKRCKSRSDKTLEDSLY